MTRGYYCLISNYLGLNNNKSQQVQQVRYCFHPGVSSGLRESLGSEDDKNEISSSDMLKGMMAYVWPKDDPLTKKR